MGSLSSALQFVVPLCVTPGESQNNPVPYIVKWFNVDARGSYINVQKLPF